VVCMAGRADICLKDCTPERQSERMLPRCNPWRGVQAENGIRLVIERLSSRTAGISRQRWAYAAVLNTPWKRGSAWVGAFAESLESWPWLCGAAFVWYRRKGPGRDFRSRENLWRRGRNEPSYLDYRADQQLPKVLDMLADEPGSFPYGRLPAERQIRASSSDILHDMVRS
jgi:hypothetical protein